MWRWVSTKPGITIMREASITSALGALMLGRTAEILPPSISTSACSKSPTARSSVSTQPPLIRIARPGVVAPPAAARWPSPPIDGRGGDGGRRRGAEELAARHAGRRRRKGRTNRRRTRRCVMVSSRVCCCVGDATPVRGSLLARRRRAATPAWVAAHLRGIEASRTRQSGGATCSSRSRGCVSRPRRRCGAPRALELLASLNTSVGWRFRP